MNKMTKTMSAVVMLGALLMLTGCEPAGPGLVSPKAMDHVLTYEKGTVLSVRELSIQPMDDTLATPNAQELIIRLDSGRRIALTTRGTTFRHNERIRVVRDGRRIVNVEHLVPTP